MPSATLRVRALRALSLSSGVTWQNGFVESFHSRFRDECLNGHLFFNLEDARDKLEAQRAMRSQPKTTPDSGKLTLGVVQ